MTYLKAILRGFFAAKPYLSPAACKAAEFCRDAGWTYRRVNDTPIVVRLPDSRANTHEVTVAGDEAVVTFRTSCGYGVHAADLPADLGLRLLCRNHGRAFVSWSAQESEDGELKLMVK